MARQHKIGHSVSYMFNYRHWQKKHKIKCKKSNRQTKRKNLN